MFVGEFAQSIRTCVYIHAIDAVFCEERVHRAVAFILDCHIIVHGDILMHAYMYIYA